MLINKDILLSFLAPIATVTSVAMVVSNAVTHGVTWTDKALLSLLALVICLCAHLLPALSKRRAVWLLWCACLVATMYSQLSFFTNVSTVAGENRAKNSVQVVNSNQQIESVNQALSRISARPVAEVARALSKSTNDKRIAALNAELDEAKRAEKLHDTLIALQGSAVTIQSAESNDPLLLLLESVTGTNAAVISIAIGTTFALVLELLAVFLWYELLSKPQPKVNLEISVSSVSSELKEMPVPEVLVSPEDEKLATLKHAIDTGKIKPTVAAIRNFLQCSQAKAMSLRKEFLIILSHSTVSGKTHFG